MKRRINRRAPIGDTDQQSAAQGRSRRARRKAAAPLFFGKQMLLFGALVIAVIILDLFFYIGVALFENDASLTGGAPNHLAREAGQSLTAVDGGWEMPDDVQADLGEKGCWCILIDYDGNVAWSTPNTPQSALRTYNLGDTAVFMRYGYLDDYPCFVWQRDDGLLVTCYPKGSYYPFSTLYLPNALVSRLPLYLLAMLLMDAAVFFAAYLISKRRVIKSVAPVVDSLNDLAQGKTVHVEASGDLREVGESVNAASAIMCRKDEARRRWVSGVSHDIRTPLAISMGHAEQIASRDDLDEDVRQSAEAILRQSARIRDLVSDLNIASKLEYDMQPLNMAPCALSKTIRSVAADYLNDGLDERYALEIEIDSAAEGVRTLIDERLVRRALRNLVDNSIRHNEAGCRISLMLARAPHAMEVTVADDGCGTSEAAIERLNLEANSLAHPPSDLDAGANGPTPPPHYDEYGPHSAKRCVGNPEGTQSGNTTRAETRNAAPSLKRTELMSFNEHGLGLSLVARIAAAHGGSVLFSGARGDGFSATLLIPLQDR